MPEAITTLSEALGRLPGIGPRSAERLALHIAQSDADAVRQLAQALVQARERIRACSVCGALTEGQTCAICADPRRDGSILCVVERPLDVFALEKAGSFRGKYHVLGGKISPLNGVEPEDLRLAELEARLAGVQEVIVALSTDVEGDATSFYLGKRLAGKGPKLTRIAHGLPAGAGVEFADEVTLSLALEGRRELAP
ncbi:MAG: recombination mediator RecR [Verrucomicrobiota bacterium]